LYDSNDNYISLTSSHLIYVEEVGYTKASNVKVGNRLRMYSHAANRLVDFVVAKISYDIKEGFVAPLTNEGTLLVNNLDASCYAEVNSHIIADIVMKPLKLWYKLAKYLRTETDKNKDELINVDYYSTILYKFALNYLPSILV
jgi:hypothetical protein